METKFAPANAAWTKVEIADHVNDIFNVDDAGEPLAQGALSPDDIMDLEAQQWANENYTWLCNARSECDDVALSMEEDWQRAWLERVRARLVEDAATEIKHDAARAARPLPALLRRQAE